MLDPFYFSPHLNLKLLFLKLALLIILVLGIELKALCMLGKRSITGLHPQSQVDAFIYLFIFKKITGDLHI